MVGVLGVVLLRTCVTGLVAVAAFLSTRKNASSSPHFSEKLCNVA
jgi:hypothetical protein